MFHSHGGILRKVVSVCQVVACLNGNKLLRQKSVHDRLASIRDPATQYQSGIGQPLRHVLQIGERDVIHTLPRRSVERDLAVTQSSYRRALEHALFAAVDQRVALTCFF